MNRIHSQAYKSASKATMSGRDIEAEILSQAALKLKACQDDWDTSLKELKLDEALKHNQMIWSVFQGDLMAEDNPLPQKLKEDMLSLSAFIDKRIFDIMAFPSPEKLNILIKINTNIAAGLRSQGENQNEVIPEAPSQEPICQAV